MARTLSERPTSLPVATSPTPPAISRASTTARRAVTGQSGIPEVPSSGLPSPPSSPPLAAFTADNRLAVTPKKRPSNANGGTRRARGGATLRIREECERFFCETMAAAFYGDRNAARSVSGLRTGVYYNNTNYHGNDQLNTPPDDDYPFPSAGASADPSKCGAAEIHSWLEVWDYVGGAGFRGFIAEDKGEKSLFVFFDPGVLGRDLKKALMALITLAEKFDCAQIVIAVAREMTEEQSSSLTKGLGWAGFSLTTLDFWTNGGVDVTSNKWLFMGLEV